MIRPILFSLVLLHTACVCAAPPTSGQYEVRKRRSDGLYDSFGVTLANGQAIGQSGGIPAPITVGGGGGSGTVTSVALSLPGIFSVSGSPVTSSGTLAASLANQSANLIWAGPASGSAAAPTFRALVAGDIPDLSGVYQAVITAGTTAQYWRGDKSWQTLNAASVGLGSVENTALSTWAGSANLTNLGTIASGIWQGTAIADTYISSASTWNAKEAALTFSSPLVRTVNTISLGASGITAGTYGSSTQVARYTFDVYGRATAVTAVTIQPPVNTITGMGAGVSTALSISIGSNGAPVVFNGDAGTPSAINLSNGSALPLSTGVSGDLPLSNLAQSSAASKLLGRGDSGVGDWQEITLGSGLTMTGTTLSASGGIGGSIGGTDNAVPRANGTGGGTVQGSDLMINDAAAGLVQVSATPGNYARMLFSDPDSIYGGVWLQGEAGYISRFNVGTSQWVCVNGDIYCTGIRIGASGYPADGLYVKQEGIGIGATNYGPKITASGTSPNENLNLNPSPAGTGIVNIGSPVKIGSNGATIAQIKTYSVTLVAGTATVSDADITSGTHVIMSVLTPGGTVGNLDFDVSSGSSFTINSSSILDTSTLKVTVIIY